MLGLNLREEFRGKRLKGTAIELSNEKNTGATQRPAAEFLEITYPSTDVLRAIEAIGPAKDKPVVLMGERGQGKSHLLAVLYHLLKDTAATQRWLNSWGDRLGNKKIGTLPLRQGMHLISHSLHKQQFKFLWDLIFDNHPHGQYIRGKWEALGDKKPEIPSDQLMLELFQKQPTAIILDEFQTWFDGLTNTKQFPWRTWAFNFIQILSEIAGNHPDLVVLVVSVRNGNSDAFQQIHRVSPEVVDFKGPQADQDRRKLLLHRLFENRLNVDNSVIEKAISDHIGEYFRLYEVPLADQEKKRAEFIETWPFAPHLMRLLEDQVLVAVSAQETRDLIRILADLYKTRGEATPILTAADFRLEDENSGIAALLDSVSNQHHRNLRDKALRNLTAVIEAVPDPERVVPHLKDLVGSLWLRSLAVGNLAGADAHALQIDITRGRKIDDNAFHVELETIKGNSFNIHLVGDRLVFKEDENPDAKLRAHARNDRLFLDGSDHLQLAREVRYVIGGSDDVAKGFRVIVLPQSWRSDPWSKMDAAEQPANWDERLPIVVVPEELERTDEILGKWLKDHLQAKRNTVRFLMPRIASGGLFADRDLIILARMVLKAQEWAKQNPGEYSGLITKYRKDLKTQLEQRFDRFAIVQTWSFTEPGRCKFHIESLRVHGSKIPDAIEEAIQRDLFVPEDFESLVLAAAEKNDSIAKLLGELQEPRPNLESSIPWLGETLMKEKIIQLCARGSIAINLRGMEYLQLNHGESIDAAWARMRGRVGSGRHLQETFILLPQAVPSTHNLQSGDGGAVTAPPLIPPTTAGLPGGVLPPVAAPVVNIPGGGIFGGVQGGGQRIPLSSPANSSINLLGAVERWGIGPATPIQNIRITIGAATGAQLQKLLRNLPDGMTFELNLEKEES